MIQHVRRACVLAGFACASLNAQPVEVKPKTEVQTHEPIMITGEKIQPLSETHWRIKVAYQQAVKTRCVAFDSDGQAVAIDSIAVLPPFSVSNMYTRPEDGDIVEVKCWITSTREQDLANEYLF